MARPRPAALGRRAAPGLTELLRVGLVGAFLVTSATCARPGRPPGGPPDLLPPQVVETSPKPDSGIASARQEIVIRFNERISERLVRGSFEDAVLVSPEVPGLKVEHRSDAIVLKAPDGWPERQAIRIRVLPVVQDLFQNSMAGPFEFAVGFEASIPFGTMAGLVTDRITGQPAPDVRLEAWRGAAESPTGPLYLTRTDSAGIYAFRRMPRGAFRLRAFTDVNRNRELDAFEPVQWDSARIQEQYDTALVSMRILTPDTTPAVVASMELADSAAVRITLDDFLDTERPIEGAGARVTTGEGAVVPAEDIVHVHEYETRVRALRRAADSLAAAADTTGELEFAPDTTTLAPDTVPLPTRDLIVLLADTLAFEVRYVVELSGVRNINGLAGGGGVDTIVRPPPPDTAAPDTVRDTAQAPPPDTGGVAKPLRGPRRRR